MKVQELFEGPYLIGQEYTPSIKMDSYPSLEGLKREFEHLGTMEKEGHEYNFWLSKNKRFAKVSVEAVDPNMPSAGKRQLIVATLSFDNRAGLPVKHELQVDTVYTHPDYRTLFVSGILYIVLARYGYSIVSDFSQYLGGQALWKKIATLSEARNYSVFIWLDEEQDWVRDSAGALVKYNASNIADDKIWLDISEHHKATTLFCLVHGDKI